MLKKDFLGYRVEREFPLVDAGVANQSIHEESMASLTV